MKIEGDVGADPIWCNKCGCNIDMEDLPVSVELADELSEWALKYGEWIDWDKDRLRNKGIEIEEEFNKLGVVLAERVKQEIGNNYKIKFFPSTSARLYTRKYK
ncbi:hypothetical protein [Metabacillus schmidteae]|uniref:hypothetical protein n=1 Tax=Metabacillus schmidteae TaxID=2730405 RepID=UPI001F24217C|nr:hypothetical protein [Metabacillus schmidteae]